MRPSLAAFAVAALVAIASAAVVEPKQKDAKNANPIGPMSPERDPRTSLVESIHRMKLSMDKELVYLARMQEVAEKRDTRGMVARQAGFTNEVNDGTDVFAPILPGSVVPSGRQVTAADMTTEPEPEPDMTSDPTPPPTTTVVPTVPVATVTSAPVPAPSEEPEPEPLPTTLPTVVPTEAPSVVPLPTEMPTVEATPTAVLPTFVPEETMAVPVPTEEVIPTALPTPVVTEVPVFTPELTPTPIVETTPTPLVETPIPVPSVTLEPETEITPTPTEEIPEITTTPEDDLDTSPEEESAANPTPTDDDSVCFPASASVSMADGSVKPMRDIALGDRVRVSADTTSSVFMFTHKMGNVRYPFVQLTTASNNTLSLTRGHYLYVNGRLAAASTVQLGDELQLADMSTSRVVNVEEKVDTGLYNPQTVHGDLIVDGVRVSTYTTAVAPRAAHAFLMPLRAAFERVGFSLTAFDAGADQLAKVVPKGTLVL